MAVQIFVIFFRIDSYVEYHLSHIITNLNWLTMSLEHAISNYYPFVAYLIKFLFKLKKKTKMFNCHGCTFLYGLCNIKNASIQSKYLNHNTLRKLDSYALNKVCT